MTAKYNGTCNTCGGAILKGTQIRWSRENGASHDDCPAPVTLTTEQAGHLREQYQNARKALWLAGQTGRRVFQAEAILDSIVARARHHGVSLR